MTDTLHIGPTLQQDLVVSILKWRLYKIVFNADIIKMYKQIQLNPSHRPYQRIFFRKSVNELIQDYELQTVTFGVNGTHYLAIATLHKIEKHIQGTASTNTRDVVNADDAVAGEIAQERLKLDINFRGGKNQELAKFELL